MGEIEASIKKEISRLARREARQLVRPLREELKRQKARNAELVARLTRIEKSREIERAAKKLETAVVSLDAVKGRLSPRLIKKLRKKLGVTQAGLARLVSVSAQAVVTWESGKSKPRPEIRSKLLGLRRMGKREVRKALETIAPKLLPGSSRPAPGKRMPNRIGNATSRFRSRVKIR